MDKTLHTKLNQETLGKLKIIAAARGQTISQFLDTLIRTEYTLWLRGQQNLEDLAALEAEAQAMRGVDDGDDYG